MSTWLEYNFKNPELTKLAAKLGYEKPLHITLVHFPRDTNKESMYDIITLVDEWIDFFPKRFWIYPKFDKLSQFDSGALVQEYIVPKRIENQRQILLQKLYSRGIKWSNDFDWNPHVTVGEGKQYDPTLFGITRVLIIGVTLHHSFGDSYEWRFKV